MTTVLTIVTCFLGVLGALVLLSQILVELKWPSMWKKTDQSRRSFLILLVSTFSGIVFGAFISHKRSTSTKVLDILYDLEIKLIQEEGLVLSALSGDTDRFVGGVLELRLEYLNRYKDEIARLVDLLKEYGETKLTSLLTNHVDILKQNAGKLKGLTSETETEALHNMLETLGAMRAEVSKKKRELLGGL
jgi:hypothetical protein